MFSFNPIRASGGVATSQNIPDTNVKRDLSGRSAFSSISLAANPISSFDAVTKAYVDVVDSKVTAVRVALHSVKDYGAIGDGVTDDSVAITALCNSVNASGGGVVYFSTGTYKLNVYLPLYPNMTFRGDGPGSILTCPTYIVLRGAGASTWSNIVIQKMTIICTSTANVTDGVIDFNGQSVSDILMEDLVIKSASGQIDAIHFNGAVGNKVNNLRINRCSIPVCTRIAIEINGFDKVGSNNITVSNCTILKPASMGIFFNGGCNGVICKENYILGNNTSVNGIEMSGSNLSDITIEGNRFSGGFSSMMISMVGTPPAASNNVLITANRSIGTVTGGIRLWNFLGGHFSNNVLNMTDRVGIETNGGNNCRIFGNRLVTNNNLVVYVKTATGVIISDNYLDNFLCATPLGVVMPESCFIRVYRNQMWKGGAGNYVQQTTGGTYVSYQNQYASGEESFGSASVTAGTLAVSGVLSSAAATVTSLSLPTAGGSASALTFFQEYDHSTTWTCGGFTTAPLLIKLSRIGRTVYATITGAPSTSAPVSAAYYVSNTALPSQFLPSLDMRGYALVGVSAGWTNGFYALFTNGIFNIYNGPPGTNFGTGVNNYFTHFSISWVV